MKKLLPFLLFFATSFAIAQQIPTIETKITRNLQYTDQEIKDYEKFEDLQYKALEKGYQLKDEDKKFINDFIQKYSDNVAQYGEDVLETELIEYPWNLLGPGCSWYCGAMYTQKVSSHLKSIGDNVYSEESLDDDIRTAWVEGVKGYGIGEYIEFSFPYYGPRATSCTLVNGYNKNETTWKKNSRVKTFNLYEDDNLIAIVNLKDTRDAQTFDLPHPIPNREDNERGDLFLDDSSYIFNKPIKLKFVITDVYKGDKYDDTAISAIIFDGLDVHCLAKGTKILMADGYEKNIEDIAIGDYVKSYNINENKFENKTVTKAHHATHSHLLEINTDKAQIVTTTDHPFLTNEGWKSFNPDKTKTYNRYTQVSEYKVGDNLLLHDSGRKIETAIINIKPIEGMTDTYTLELDGNGAFIANGLIVGQE